MKPLHLALVIAATLISTAFFFTLSPSGSPGALTPSTTNVHIENGVQVVTIAAKGGYMPRVTRAQAGVPTVVRMVTNGTYDCSSALRIPSLGVGQYLPATGATDIALGTPATSTLQGTCAMGMYSFAIQFE